MELLYSWIENFNILKKQGINFGGQFLFEFNENEKRPFLKINENINYINNFFTHDDRLSNVKNITAICGQNGSGKTTVLKYLLDILKEFTNQGIKEIGINREFRFIFAFIDYAKDSKNEKDKRKFTIYIICDDKKRFTIKNEAQNIVICNDMKSISTSDKTKNKAIHLSLIEDFDKCIELLKKIGYFYYSPIIDMDYGIPDEDNKKNKNYMNLSLKSKLDTYLKYNEDYNISGIGTNMSKKNGYKSLDKFWTESLIKIIDFISELNNETISKNLHVPDKILMYPTHVYDALFYNTNTVNQLVDEEHILSYFKLDIIKATNFEKKIYKIIEEKYLNSSTDVCKLIGEYLLLVINTFFEGFKQDFDANIIDCFNKENEETQVLKANSIQSILEEYTSNFMELINNIKNDKNKIKKYKLEDYFKFFEEEKVIKNIDIYIDIYIDMILEIEKIFRDLKKNNYIDIIKTKIHHFTASNIKDNKKSYNMIEREAQYCSIKINTTESIDFIKKLVSLFIKLPTSKNINVIGFEGISSGETAKLNLLTHLNKGIKKLEQENIISFIDEGESYYHPEWKRNYLNEIIEFFNSRIQNKKIQIIFTSNSPYSISDLPKENVVLIRKGEIIKDEEYFENTFAANIHTLLTKSFFMENGTIGEFAKNKIQYVINLLNSNDKEKVLENRDDIYIIIQMIGEPITKKILENKFFRIIEEHLESVKKINEEIKELERERQKLLLGDLND